MGFEKVYERFINCDLCGRLTRGRIWDNEPSIARCGSCHAPMSEGSFVYRAESKETMGGWSACSKN